MSINSTKITKQQLRDFVNVGYLVVLVESHFKTLCVSFSIKEKGQIVSNYTVLLNQTVIYTSISIENAIEIYNAQ